MDDHPSRRDDSRQKPAARPQAGRWVLVLFGLPFAAAGIALFVFLVLPPLLDWRAAQSWVPVQAELLYAGLQTHSDSDGGDTWEATARYRYEFAAGHWEGDRVALNRGADNIGSFQQDLATRLGMAFAVGEPVTVYVNPRDPREAIINRELRPGLMLLMGLFSLVFALVGLGIMAAGVFTPRATPATAASAGAASTATPAALPQPWRVRE